MSREDLSKNGRFQPRIRATE